MNNGGTQRVRSDCTDTVAVAGDDRMGQSNLYPVRGGGAAHAA
jgi:hypothetical protein